jgi:hypothetical protein
MSGSTETQFTATGPAPIGFQTQPPETNTQFEIGVDVSGFSLGVKATGTGGVPTKPESGGTGVEGHGTGIGSGVQGFGGNATPGSRNVGPFACAGMYGTGGQGPQSGGPGVAGFGGPSSGVGVLGQGSASGNPRQFGGPGVKGIGGATSATDFADGVQGFGAGGFSGVAGWGGTTFGTGAVGFGGGPGGPGVRGIGAGGPNTVPTNPDGSAQPTGVYGQGGAQSPGVVGQGGIILHLAPGWSGSVARRKGWGVWGIVGAGSSAGPTFPCGVFGQASGGIPGSIGVEGMGDFGLHGVTQGKAGQTGVHAEAPNGIGIFASGLQAGFFAGDLVVAGGTKSVAVPFPDGSHRQLYCVESPENWFEDFGFGHLTDGRASILLDRDFATTINTDNYHVFITEYDDHNGLFVTSRTNMGFEVRAKTSAKDAAFSYRVVARRKDIAPARLAKVALPTRSLEPIKLRLVTPGQ